MEPLDVPPQCRLACLLDGARSLRRRCSGGANDCFSGPKTRSLAAKDPWLIPRPLRDNRWTGVGDAAGGSGDFAGNQIDVRIRYWIVPQTVRFETNLVYLAKSDFPNAPNAPPSDDTFYAAFDVMASF
jgi:hypothetical protein